MCIIIVKKGLIMSRLQERTENFNRAFDLYQNMRNEYISDKSNDTKKLAIVQSFEIVFELAWKVLKDYLYENGIEANYPKMVIKEAFNKKTIANGQVWIDMSETRNSTSHEYNTEKVDIMIEKIAYPYYDELLSFKNKVKELLNA